MARLMLAIASSTSSGNQIRDDADLCLRIALVTVHDVKLFARIGRADEMLRDVFEERPC